MVSAHFGLRQDHKHDLGCKYDIDATLRKIVAKSREVRDLGPAALVEHVGSREQESVEFRLHVLMTGLEPGRILNSQDTDPEAAYAYRESNRRLTAYMNCVESIVMVARVVGDDADLEEKVQVVLNGEKIPWRDFFYGLKEHRRLWQAREKIQGRPVTVEFERRERERNASAPYRANGHYQISGHFELEEGSPPYNVQVQLQVADKALADVIWNAKRAVVCGVPRFTFPDFGRSRPGGYPPFAHIILPVRDRSQVFATEGGPLEAPEGAADERPAHVPSRDAATDMPASGSGVSFTGMPIPETQWSPDVPPIEDALPGGTTPEHPHSESEEGRPAKDGADKAVDMAGSDAGEQVPSSKQADPEPDACPPNSSPVGPGAPAMTEMTRDTESPCERRPETEEAFVHPENGAAPAQPPKDAAQTPQSTAIEDMSSVPAASDGRATEQPDAPPSPRQEAVTVCLPTPVTSNVRLHRSRGPMARATQAMKQRAAQVMERSHSAGRRLLAWFGGKG